MTRSRLAPWIRQEALGAILALSLSGIVRVPAFPQAADLSALLTPEEQARLTRERNPAKQVRLLLGYAEKRLQESKRLAAQERFEPALALLHTYQTLLEDAFSRIEAVPPGGKRKNAYKDFTLHLRRHLKNLEALTRALPIGLATDAERVLKTATRLRSEALNAFAGERILTLPPRPRSQ